MNLVRSIEKCENFWLKGSARKEKRAKRKSTQHCLFPGSSLQCYVCNSYEDALCADPFFHDDVAGEKQPKSGDDFVQQCPDDGKQYFCRKIYQNGELSKCLGKGVISTKSHAKFVFVFISTKMRQRTMEKNTLKNEPYFNSLCQPKEWVSRY